MDLTLSQSSVEKVSLSLQISAMISSFQPAHLSPLIASLLSILLLEHIHQRSVPTVEQKISSMAMSVSHLALLEPSHIPIKMEESPAEPVPNNLDSFLLEENA